MAEPALRAIEESRNYEKDLNLCLANGNLRYAIINEFLSGIRSSCGGALLTDFTNANSEDHRAEDRLWESHQKVHKHFTSALAKLKNSPERHAVEIRKLGQEYLKFIKGSQNFYREFLGKLSCTYRGIPALERVAKKFRTDSITSQESRGNSPDPFDLEQCCHRTLIHLGDLSRYRETELQFGQKNWAPAYGYYDLALVVHPGSGIPFNQRAVIALADQSLFRAIYNVFRSLTAEDPHPQAESNLKRTMRMIHDAWQDKTLVNTATKASGAALPNALVVWYLRLLERFNHGKDFDERAQMENEMIGQFEVDLKKRVFESPPHRLVTTSIAAQYTAQERFRNRPTSVRFQNSYIFYVQFNLRLFSALLRVVTQELDESYTGMSTIEKESLDLANRLGPVSQRVLPVLRLYLAWLPDTSAILESPDSGISRSLVSNFWSSLCRCLNSFADRFPSGQLPDIHHLLEEDEDTMGFKPLKTASARNLWYENGTHKPRWEDVSHRSRDVSSEMLYRVKDMLRSGLKLALSEAATLVFDQSSSRFRLCNSDYSDQRSDVATSDLRGPALKPNDEHNGEAETATSPSQIEESHRSEKHQNKKAEVEQMVDSIVESVPDASHAQSRSLDSLPETDAPMTPPQSVPNNNVYEPRTLSELKPQTVKDIMATVYKPSDIFHLPTVKDSTQSSSASRSGSQQQSPETSNLQIGSSIHPLQSSRRNLTEGSTPYNTVEEHPFLPGLGVLPKNVGQSPLQKSSPLPPPFSHSRVNSNDSTPKVWGGSGIFSSNYRPTDARTHSGQNSPIIPSCGPSRTENVFTNGRRNYEPGNRTAESPLQTDFPSRGWNGRNLDSSRSSGFGPANSSYGENDMVSPRASSSSHPLPAGK